MKKPHIVLLAVLALIVATVLFKSARKEGTPPPSAGSTPEKAQSRTRKPRATPREADRLLAAEGATTDATLSTFPEKEYQHIRPPAGKAAGAPGGEAYIHVPSAGRRVAMEANQLGEFPTVEAGLRDTVGVRLSLDSVKPGTPVRIVIMDGGSFPSAEGFSQVLEAAAWHGVSFEFTTSANIGTHRVLVQAAGQASRILDFNALSSDG